MPTSSLLLDNAAICRRKLESHHTIMPVFPLTNHNDIILSPHKLPLNRLQASLVLSDLRVTTGAPHQVWELSSISQLKRGKVIVEIRKRTFTQGSYTEKRNKETKQSPQVCLWDAEVRVYLAYLLQSIIRKAEVGTRGKSLKAKTEAETTEERRSAAHRLPLACSPGLLIQPRTTCSEVSLPTVR